MKPRVVYDKKCIICEKKYQANRKDSKVCSDTCRVKKSQRNIIEKEVLERDALNTEEKKKAIIAEAKPAIIAEAKPKEVAEIKGYAFYGTCWSCNDKFGGYIGEVEDFWENHNYYLKNKRKPKIKFMRALYVCNKCLSHK
jgi:hypothetical protein